MEVLGLMARRSPHPDVPIDDRWWSHGVVAYRSERCRSGEVMRTYVVMGSTGFTRSEWLEYRPDRAGG